MVDLIRGFFLKLSWTRIWEMYFGCTVPIFPTMQSSRWFVESRRVQRPLKIFTFVCLEYSRYDLPVNTNWIPVGIVRLEGMIWENPKFHFQKLKGTFIHGIPNPRIQAKGTNPIFSWPAEHEGHHKTWTLVLEASDSWFLRQNLNIGENTMSHEAMTKKVKLFYMYPYLSVFLVGEFSVICRCL